MKNKGLVQKTKENLAVEPILDNIDKTREILLTDKSLTKESKFRVNTIFNYFKENPDRVSGKNVGYLVEMIEGLGNYSLKNDLNKAYKEFGLKC